MQISTSNIRVCKQAALLACLVVAAFAAILPFANAQLAQPDYNPKNVALPEVCKAKGPTAPGELGKDIVECRIRGVGTPTTPTVLKFSFQEPPDFDILITVRFRSGEGMLNFQVPGSDMLSSDPSWQAFVSGPKDVATLYIQRTVFEDIFRQYGNSFTDFGFEIATTSLSSNFIATVFTPTKPKRLDPKDEAVLKQLYTRCCPEGGDDGALCRTLAAATNATRSLEDDICNDPPNMCDEQNRLFRLVMYPIEEEDRLQCKGGALPLDLISQLTTLDYLDFDSNGLTADVADVSKALAKLPHLETTYLSDNNLTGKLDCGLIKAPMQRLWLSNNNIEGTVPPCFFSSQDLTTLSLSGNRLTGSLPRIKAPVSLVNLLLNSQQTGYGFEALPPNLEEATSLQTLFAQGHGFSGPLPELPPSIVEVALDRNKLEGTIPKAYTALQNLQTLGLSRNQISGTIPSDLIKAPQLSIINLADNKISGAIDKLPWNDVAGSLAWIDLSNNSLTGPLPAFPISDTNYFRVTSLFLSNNQLTGTLDAFASTIIPLDRTTNPGGAPIYGNYFLRIALNNNQFTGSVPNGLANMLMWDATDTTRAANLLDLSGNQLSGRFPLWIFNSIGKVGGLFRVLIDLDGNKMECPGQGDVTALVRAVQDAYNFTCYLPEDDAYVPVDQALSGSYNLPDPETSTSLPRSLGPSDSTPRSSATTTSSAPPSSSSSKSSSGLSTPALIGICVGAVVGGGLLIVLAIVLAYKISKKKGSKKYNDFDKGNMQMQPVAPTLGPAPVLPPQSSVGGASTV